MSHVHVHDVKQTDVLQTGIDSRQTPTLGIQDTFTVFVVKTHTLPQI